MTTEEVSASLTKLLGYPVTVERGLECRYRVYREGVIGYLVISAYSTEESLLATYKMVGAMFEELILEEKQARAIKTQKRGPYNKRKWSSRYYR